MQHKHYLESSEADPSAAAGKFVCVFVCMCVCVCVCMCVCVCVYLCERERAHARACAHITYIHLGT